jgi:hypothetical protein
MAKRVLFLTTSAQINPAAGGRTRVVSEYRYALSERYPVVMLSLVPPSQWRHPLELLRARHLLQQDAGCRVCYWPALPAFGRRWLLKLAARMQAVVVLLFGLALRVGGIHAHGQAATAAAVRARKMGLKTWVLFDAHGAGPDEYAFAASNPDPRWTAELEREEQALLSSADEVVYVSQAMGRHYREKYGLEPSHWSVVPCATNSATGWDPEQRNRLRKEMNLEERLVFVYSGSYRKYQMADEMAVLFKEIKHALAEAYLLILTGDRERFSAAVTQGGLSAEDCRIVSLSHQEVFRTLPAADVGFLLRADSPVNRVASPTKFAEYCICGVPTLLTNSVGDYSFLVEEKGLGYRLENLKVCPALISFLRDVEGHRELFAQRCHQYALRHLTWTSAGAVLRAAYARLSDASGHFPQPAEEAESRKQKVEIRGPRTTVPMSRGP